MLVYLSQHTEEPGIIASALRHHDYALVNILQPYVSYNKINTFQWFRENTYYLSYHEPADRTAAFAKATEQKKLPLGVFYRRVRNSFEDALSVHEHRKEPLFTRRGDPERLKEVIDGKRRK